MPFGVVHSDLVEAFESAAPRAPGEQWHESDDGLQTPSEPVLESAIEEAIVQSAEILPLRHATGAGRRPLHLGARG